MSRVLGWRVRIEVLNAVRVSVLVVSIEFFFSVAK
jgi:hypothetical protein